MFQLQNNELHQRLWNNLLNRFDDPVRGFDTFSDAEIVYWCIRNLEREAYRGGLEMFFFNSSGELYEETVRSLSQIGASKSADILKSFANEAFAGKCPPRDTGLRRAALNAFDELELVKAGGIADKLGYLDDRYCEDPDNIDERLHIFALDQGLIER